MPAALLKARMKYSLKPLAKLTWMQVAAELGGFEDRRVYFRSTFELPLAF